jgi:hypothetical protein
MIWISIKNIFDDLSLYLKLSQLTLKKGSIMRDVLKKNRKLYKKNLLSKEFLEQTKIVYILKDEPFSSEIVAWGLVEDLGNLELTFNVYVRVSERKKGYSKLLISEILNEYMGYEKYNVYPWDGISRELYSKYNIFYDAYSGEKLINEKTK